MYYNYFAHITRKSLNLFTSTWPREHMNNINLDQGVSSLPPQHIHLNMPVFHDPRINNYFMAGVGGGDGFIFTPAALKFCQCHLIDKI